MDRQVCASYICFLIYLVAHRKAKHFPPRVDGAGAAERAAIKPKRKLFYLMTLSALASTFGEIVRPICFAVFIEWESGLVGVYVSKEIQVGPYWRIRASPGNRRDMFM